MTVSKSQLDSKASAIAVRTGLPIEAVAVWQKQDGSFGAMVFGVPFSSSSLDAVLAWAAGQAHLEADREIEQEDTADRSDDCPSP